MATPKIYTKTGDQGQTSLVNGQRVKKSDPRLDCYGSVDELNSFAGLLLSELQSYAFDGIVRFLTQTQNHLFNLGSQLACPDAELAKQLPDIKEEFIKHIESEIDELSKTLPPLKEFVLPGGHVLSSHAHVCRTVCRRVERHCAALSETTPLPPHVIAYLNRLNDYFFVLARYFNHALGSPEVVWKK